MKESRSCAIEYYGDIGHNNLYALVSEMKILDKRFLKLTQKAPNEHLIFLILLFRWNIAATTRKECHVSNESLKYELNSRLRCCKLKSHVSRIVNEKWIRKVKKKIIIINIIW